MSLAIDKNGVIHASTFFGHIYKMIDAVLEGSKKQEKTLTMCWNGTLATVKPDDTQETAYKNWHEAREDYQTDKNQSHEALCSCCKSPLTED